MSSRFLLGTAGWDQPEWAASFYPSDMPVEWRLSFFNTQFECVYLEERVWRQASAAEREVWAADTHEHFVFLFENARRDELPAVLADRGVGLRREDARLLWFDRDTDLKRLAGQVATGEGDLSRYLISADADLGQIERVRTLLQLMGL